MINKILAIAINDYDDYELNKIQNCKNDLSAIIKILTEKYTFDEVDFIYEKKDTDRKSLYNKLNHYFINRLEDENVLLIYAGHGQYNAELKTAYWQPSDSDYTDSSTWLNIGDVLTFIKASKAFHIGVISDSCFSGAIFEPTTRGGGIDAFEKRRSRLGLTSGGIERVSDGNANLSPFAMSLIKLLDENKSAELPFGVLATNLILDFTANKSQTPMFGSLFNVGHEGGSFIFKLKKGTEVIQDKISFLKDRLKNLYIDIADDDYTTLELIKPINIQKINSVKNQKFDIAAQFRDQEKELEQQIYNRFTNSIESIFTQMKFSVEEVDIASKLDKDVKRYLKALQKEKDSDEMSDVVSTEEIKRIINEANPSLNTFVSKMTNILSFGYFLERNPARNKFNNAKDKFITSYSLSLIDIYKEFLRIKSTSKCEFFDDKNNEIKSILLKVYKYEIGLLIKGYSNDFDELIALKDLDMEVLNWIRN